MPGRRQTIKMSVEAEGQKAIKSLKSEIVPLT